MALWGNFYKNIELILSGKAKRENFQFLENSNIELIDEIDRVVKLYVNSNVDSSSRLRLLNDINLAGKQRMLTQRMATNILAISNNIDRDPFKR